MVYMTAKDAALKWGVSDVIVRRYCKQGRINGAINTDGNWQIPANAKKPKYQSTPKTPLPPLVKKILKQKENHVHNGVYSYIQVNLSYSNSRMASNRLTRDQTQELFFKDKVKGSFEPVKVSEVIEMINHFMCVDYILENSTVPLSHSFVQKLHYLLKFASYSDRKMISKPGTYRTKPYNRKRIWTSEEFSTASASEITPLLSDLFDKYEARPIFTIDDLLDFHVKFERIHPFDDGNGRVGRLIIFKECLRHNIPPFIIDDKHRGQYLKGLQDWDSNQEILRSVCQDAQERFNSKQARQDLVETHCTTNKVY